MEYWYAPGYVSTYTGCCHCEASCDHDTETSDQCAYYDDPGDSNDDGDSSSCRCCEAVFPTGDPECDDSSEFFASLMDAGADHTYAYDRDDGTQMCGSCSVPSMTYDECEAIIPFSASETSNYEQDWGCTYWSDEDCPECGSSDECAAEAGCHSFCCDTYGECCGEDGDGEYPATPEECDVSLEDCCSMFDECSGCTPYTSTEWHEFVWGGYLDSSTPCVCVQGDTLPSHVSLTQHDDCLFLNYFSDGELYGGGGDDTIVIDELSNAWIHANSGSWGG